MYLLCGDANVVRKVCVGYDHWVMTTTPPSVNLETKCFLSPIYGSSHCIVQHNSEDVSQPVFQRNWFLHPVF